MSITLDVHTHLLPLDPAALALPGIALREGKLVIDGHVLGISALHDPDRLLAWMDENGVAHAWVSLPPPAYRPHLEEAEAEAWFGALNAALLAIALARPARLTALLHLPVHLPALAARMADAAIAWGHRHFSMPSGAGEETRLSDPAFRPLWQQLDAVGADLFLHPAECADGRLKPFYLSNLLGNPHETSVAVAHLVFGGVLEEFSQMRLCLAHGGGTVPALAGRWDQGHHTARPGVDTTRALPSQMLRRLHVDCICHSDAALYAAEAVFGADRLVFGSDWPFPMGLLTPHRQLAGLPDEMAQRILHENPARLARKGETQ